VVIGGYRMLGMGEDNYWAGGSRVGEVRGQRDRTFRLRFLKEQCRLLNSVLYYI